jgi:transcriptional regulator with XRE-family HTH domain
MVVVPLDWYQYRLYPGCTNLYLYLLERNPMPDLRFSELLSRARADKGWTRQQLADATGYSAVMIAKLESGERVPDARRIPKIAEELGIDATELMRAASRTDRRKSGTPTVADAMELAKDNGVRANTLAAATALLVGEAYRPAQELDERVREFDLTVVRPISALLSRVAEIPEDAIVRTEVEAHQPNPEFSSSLTTMQMQTGKSIYALLGAGLWAGGAEDAGDAVGRGAATAPYMTVASLAMAFAGAAMSGLSGVAYTLTGISLRAAGGMGVTTATRLRNRVVRTRVEMATAKAAREVGGRTLSTQQSIRRELEIAEAEYAKDFHDVRKFESRAASISEILAFALQACRNHKRTIENAVPGDREIAWSALGASAQASIRRTAEIMLACLTVLSLPITMNWSQTAPEDALGTRALDEDSAPHVELVYEVGAELSELENEFIDYVIQEAFAQVAR